VTSVRALYADGLEVEFGIAPADWASEPCDAGTEQVARGGFVVLLDRDGHATSLAATMPAAPAVLLYVGSSDTGGRAALARGAFHRWLYRGQRPNVIARVVNRAWAAVASTGVATDYLVTLEVAGRKSGRTLSLPLVMVVVDGQRYLVSMLGDDVQWVHNVRAAGGRAVLRSGGREAIQLEEISADQRAPILQAYLQRAPGARPHVPVDKDAPPAEFEKVAAAFPVFRVASNETAEAPRSSFPIPH
jgi:deazaflavin-dependent oxidoreductase (nitroreductase family)